MKKQAKACHYVLNSHSRGRNAFRPTLRFRPGCATLNPARRMRSVSSFLFPLSSLLFAICYFRFGIWDFLQIPAGNRADALNPCSANEKCFLFPLFRYPLSLILYPSPPSFILPSYPSTLPTPSPIHVPAKQPTSVTPMFVIAAATFAS